MGKAKGPEFIRFFKPIIEVLKETGGSGTAAEVIDRVIEKMRIPEPKQEATLKGGQSRVRNQVQWARLYLARAGYLDSSNFFRGIWSLTDEGLSVDTKTFDVLGTFKEVQKDFREEKKVKDQGKPLDTLDNRSIYQKNGSKKSKPAQCDANKYIDLSTEILKSLPNETMNCKKCGYPTCISFAKSFSDGKGKLDACPYVPNDFVEKFSSISNDDKTFLAKHVEIETPAPNDLPTSQVKGLAKVAGMQELKTVLEKDVIGPLKNPDLFYKYRLTIPNGVLLYGPPGCGKTYIARQLAEELGYYFVEIIPSAIASSYIHQTSTLIRDLFKKAAEKAPSIVFIDEFDALVPSRDNLGGDESYKSEEVNEFLAHLDSCAEKKIFVIAATNEPQKIDPAIKRTGRLDKLIYVGPPDLEARVEMLKFNLRDRPVEDNLEISAIAKVLEGYSASDIKFLVDEAARDALENNVKISTAIIMNARRRVPPSITKKEEEHYRSFMSRGI